MKILDANDDFVRLLFAFLLLSDKCSYLPEIYEIFGYENTIKLLETFAGITVKFPTVEELTQLAVDIKIYIRLKKVPLGSREMIIGELSDEYNLNSGAIKMRYIRFSKEIEDNLGLKFLFKK